MTFKDIIKNDIDTTFLNEDEFAEKHVVDGKEMTIIIDNNEMLEREKRYKEQIEKGTYVKQILFYVKAGEFGRLPRIGRLLNLDGKNYIVTDAIREGAMYSISLEANKS